MTAIASRYMSANVIRCTSVLKVTKAGPIGACA